ncbi:MAG: VOC family protein [Bacteroidota bacterium]
MSAISRMMTTICSDNLVASKAFYIKLLNLQVRYDSEWFVQLTSENTAFELGIINRTNAIVPEGFQQHPQGFYLTFVVADVDAIFKIAQKENMDIVSEPTDTFYGQRRLLLKDPNGALVDISAPMQNF